MPNQVADGMVLHKGQHYTLGADLMLSPEQRLLVAWFMSAGLGGLPVVCRNFLPGVSLRIGSRVAEASVERACAERWPLLRRWLNHWLDGYEEKPQWSPPVGSAHITFARDALVCLPPGAVEIHIEHGRLPYYSSSEIEASPER